MQVSTGIFRTKYRTTLTRLLIHKLNSSYTYLLDNIKVLICCQLHISLTKHRSTFTVILDLQQ